MHIAIGKTKIDCWITAAARKPGDKTGNRLNVPRSLRSYDLNVSGGYSSACPELAEGSRGFRNLGFHGRIKLGIFLEVEESAGRREPSLKGTLDRDAHPPKNAFCKNYNVISTRELLFNHTDHLLLSTTYSQQKCDIPVQRSQQSPDNPRLFAFYAPQSPLYTYIIIRTYLPCFT